MATGAPERPRCLIEHECCGRVTIATDPDDATIVTESIDVCHNEKVETYSHQATLEGTASDFKFECLDVETAAK